MLNELKIGPKLIGGFLIVALIAAVIGIIGTVNIKKISNRDTLLYEKAAEPLKALIGIAMEYQTIRLSLWEALNSQNVATHEEKLKELEEHRKLISEAVDEFEKNIIDEKIRKGFEGFREANKVFDKDIDKVIVLVKGDKDKEAIELLMGDFDVHAMDGEKRIDNLESVVSIFAKNIADNNAKTASQASILMIVSLVFGVLLAFALGIIITLSITRPVNTVVQAARKIADEDLANLTDVLNAASSGDFSRLPEIKTQELTIKSKDEVGILANTFNQMIAKFKVSGEAVEQFINSVKALTVDANMLSKAAVDGKLDTRADVFKHNGDFRKIVQGVNDTLDAVIGPLNVAAEYVDRISKGDIPQRITDTYHGDFNEIKNNLNQCIEAIENQADAAQRIGNGDLSVKINIRSEHDVLSKGLNDVVSTLQLLINEMNRMSTEHDKGDIDVKIDTSKFKGEYCKMAEGVNTMVFGHISVKKKAMACIKEFGEGNFNAELEQFPGKKKFINDTIELVRSNIKTFIADMNHMSTEHDKGDIDVKIDESRFMGDFAKMAAGVNNMVFGHIAVKKMAMECFSEFGKGNLNAQIQTLPGKKKFINETIDQVRSNIQALSTDISALVQASVDGKLDTRADATKHQGDFRKIMEGINSTLDAILHPIGEGNRILRLIRGGNLREKVTIDCKGDHQLMKDAVNGVHSWLSELITYVTEIANGDLENATMNKASADDQIHEWLMLMKSNINALAVDATMLSKAAVEGKLATRADAEKHNGDFRKIVEGVNDTLDAVITPINEAQSVLEKVAARDLTVRVNGEYKGDMARIKTAINSAVDNLDKALQQVTEATEQVTSAGGQISSGSQSLAQGANEQASSLEEVSSSLEEMASMTKQNADNANQAKGLAAESDTYAKSGSDAMGRMSSAINRIKESSDQTAKIVKTIDEIAMQTNLLALNAAVEAARAGEAGRGFAVVAEEVRNLAQRSAQAAKNTADMITESVRNADDGVKIATEVSQSFETIANSAKKVNDLIAEIAAASQEQSSGIEQINTAVAQMDKVTQQNAANSEESASAAEELSSQAEELKNMISQFALSQSMMSVSAPRKMAAAHTVVHAPEKEKSNYKAIGKKPTGKTTSIKPEDIIPLDDEALKEF